MLESECEVPATSSPKLPGTSNQTKKFISKKASSMDSKHSIEYSEEADVGEDAIEADEFSELEDPQSERICDIRKRSKRIETSRANLKEKLKEKSKAMKTLRSRVVEIGASRDLAKAREKEIALEFKTSKQVWEDEKAAFTNEIMQTREQLDLEKVRFKELEMKLGDALMQVENFQKNTPDFEKKMCP